MVRNYLRKTKRQSWTEESMKNAVNVSTSTYYFLLLYNISIIKYISTNI